LFFFLSEEENQNATPMSWVRLRGQFAGWYGLNPIYFVIVALEAEPIHLRKMLWHSGENGAEMEK